MAQPLSQLVPTDTASTFHCVQRCVRRAFLCGIDDYTSAEQLIDHAKRDPAVLTQSLSPTSGWLLRCLPIRMGDYLELVDWTGRHLREGKPGAIPNDEPSVLQSLDPTSQRWTVRVSAIGPGYWHVVGEAHDLIAVAQRIGQRWVKGLGLAKKIARPT